MGAPEVVNAARAHGTPTRQIKDPPQQEKVSPSIQPQLLMGRNNGKEGRMVLSAACTGLYKPPQKPFWTNQNLPVWPR